MTVLERWYKISKSHSDHLAIGLAEYKAEIAPKIGQVALSWNLIHLYVFILFVGFSRQPRKLASIEFYKIKSDLLQRKKTLALAILALDQVNDESSNLIKINLTELFDNIDNNSSVRNIFIHGSIAINELGFIYSHPYHPDTVRNNNNEHYMKIDEYIDKLEYFVDQLDLLLKDCKVKLKWADEFMA